MLASFRPPDTEKTTGGRELNMEPGEVPFVVECGDRGRDQVDCKKQKKVTVNNAQIMAWDVKLMSKDWRMANKKEDVMGCFWRGAVPKTRWRPYFVSKKLKLEKESVGKLWYRCNRRTAFRCPNMYWNEDVRWDKKTE